MAPGTLRVVDTHDVHFERMSLFPPPGLFRLPRRDMKRYREMEIETLRTFHVVLALTEGDRDLLARHLDNEIRVVPTGVDMSLFPLREPRPAIPDRIGFFGAVSNPANLDGILHFYEAVYPRIRKQVPSVRLHIVGGHVPPEVDAMARRDPSVHVTGFVPDLQGELERLQLAVMPLRKTSGIRGRMYEIMASRVPVVAYPAAVRGMSLTPGRHYIEAADADGMADAVVDLLHRPERGGPVAGAAYDHVRTACSHEATYGAFCEVLERRIRDRR
jgi:glycosyltransferase involved in cell wall biosynthesis